MIELKSVLFGRKTLPSYPLSGLSSTLIPLTQSEARPLSGIRRSSGRGRVINGGERRDLGRNQTSPAETA